ncbi:MAG TPA: DUF2844 domain-containing protein [Terriglobales bacterium]|nr:DUF2844 domain-containing protein [Terriglobales bacterium]
MKPLIPTASSFRGILLSTFLIALCVPAWAGLGDNAASVLTDQARMKGTLRSVDHTAYVMHEITTPYGAKVREYVTPAGAVFAVAWEGQFPPNFQQLLGPYYQQVQQALAQQRTAGQSGSEQAPRQRRGPVYVATPGIVFAQSGHMRSFHGQAYIPQLVPQGVQPSNIR